MDQAEQIAQSIVANPAITKRFDWSEISKYDGEIQVNMVDKVETYMKDCNLTPEDYANEKIPALTRKQIVGNELQMAINKTAATTEEILEIAREIVDRAGKDGAS
jgi:hypothetical protein